MKISSILKNSLKYTGVSFFSTFLSVPKNIVLAAVLTPSDFGIYAFIWLFVEYSYHLSPGFINASTREMTAFIGNGEPDKALEIERYGNGADLIYTVLLSLAIALGGIFFHASPFLIYGFVFSGINFFINKVLIYYFNANYYRDEYNVTVAARAIQNGGASVICIVLVFFIKEWSLFVAPLVAALFAFLYYFYKSKNRIEFRFNRKMAWKLLRTGILLSFAWLLWRSFRIADKTVISVLLPRHELGLFAFASIFILFPHNAMLDFGNVLMPLLWRFWGKKNPQEFMETSRKYVYFLALVSGLIITTLQFLFYFMSVYITVKFAPALEFFNILCLSVFFMSIVIIPNIMLASKNINRQNISVITHFIGLAINVMGDIYVIRLGYGLYGVAFVTLFTQILVTGAQFFFSIKYFAIGMKEKCFFLLKVHIPVFIAALLIVIQPMIQMKIKNPLLFLLFGVIAAGLWFAVIRIFYKEFFNIKWLKTMLSRKVSPETHE